MHTKAPPPIALLGGRRALPIVEVWFELAQLKHLFRQGWLRVGIPEARCETVAEHSFGVALLALFIAETWFPEADASRVLRIAVLHDLGEAYAGDITPHDRIDRAEKHDLERHAIERIFEKLPNGEDYIDLWDEYEHSETLEAKIVKQADRLEMALQATLYELEGGYALGDFFESARKVLEAPELKTLLTEIESLRPTGR